MTPDEARKNAATVRGLREALDHNLPSDMRRGIEASIALLQGRPDPTPAPPAPLGPAFTAKVTLNGETFPHPTTSTPRRPF
jgi:hypothetical protein